MAAWRCYHEQTSSRWHLAIGSGVSAAAAIWHIALANA